MKRVIVGSICLLLCAITHSLQAGEPTGWRGDGTGIYPKATPPTQWKLAGTLLDGLRFQADKPKSDEPAGSPMPDGVIRDWLILGTVDGKLGDNKLPTDEVFAEDLSKLNPSAGDKAWKAIHNETNYTDFAVIFDTYSKPEHVAAYAASHIYCPQDATFLGAVQSTGPMFVWVNGKLTHKAADAGGIWNWPQIVKLTKGWNTIIIRSTPVLAGQGPKFGTWYMAVNLVSPAAPEPSGNSTQNIAWRTAMPSQDGFGSPVASGGKVFLQSQPYDLVCVDAATGKILWVRSNNYVGVATAEERNANADIFAEADKLAARLQEIDDSFATDSPPKLGDVGGRAGYKEKAATEAALDKLMLKVDNTKYQPSKGQDVGQAGFTPVCDGQRVYAWFANGVTCCYDYAGKLIWRRVDNEGSFFEHGYSVSPVLVDGKLIVYMNKLIALDAAKGERLWTCELPVNAPRNFHGTPAVAKIGKDSVMVLPTGWIVNVADGKILRNKGPEILGHNQEIPSPVVIGSTVYRASTWSQFTKYSLPKELSDPLSVDGIKMIKIPSDKQPLYYNDWIMASPLVHEGLAYLLNNIGVLTVVDVEKMEIVYQKQLDVDHFQTVGEVAGRGIGVSPALAGGNIYLFGNSGSCVVIKPGRKYEQVAKNHIDSVVGRNWATRHERFVACPAFDGKRLFIRGELYLYCVEAK